MSERERGVGSRERGRAGGWIFVEGEYEVERMMNE